jgi:hypothetical protein
LVSFLFFCPSARSVDAASVSSATGFVGAGIFLLNLAAFIFASAVLLNLAAFSFCADVSAAGVADIVGVVAVLWAVLGKGNCCFPILLPKRSWNISLSYALQSSEKPILGAMPLLRGWPFSSETSA